MQIILNKCFHIKQPIGKRFKIHRTESSMTADKQFFYHRKSRNSFSLQVEMTVTRKVSTLRRHPKELEVT